MSDVKGLLTENVQILVEAKDAQIASLTVQIEQQQARIATLEGALKELRDWFAYGQQEHTGMSAVATPRCSPSAWKEIKRRVDAALAAEGA